MKLLVHLDCDPTESITEAKQVKLWLRESPSEAWHMAGSRPIDTLTATSLFVIEGWPRHQKIDFKVTCEESKWTGIFRAEPKAESVLKLAALSCHKDIGWPWKEAIDELIAHDPDLVFFSGDQIYENDYGSRMFRQLRKLKSQRG